MNTFISVIIPVKDSANTISSCIDALILNKDINFELIVVDDGCTDKTMDIVSQYPCISVKNDIHRGVSGARNKGALMAKGDVLVFIDSDILVQKDMLSKVAEHFKNSCITAVVGRLGEHIRFDNFPSQYKNLWMYNTFEHLPYEVSLLFTSISAIRRNIFLEFGGFNINYRYPNVEDNELGIRLKAAGHKIILDKTLQVEHLKYYTVITILKTHYFRTKGLFKLYVRNRLAKLSKSNQSSISNIFILNAPLSLAFISLLLTSPFINGYFFFKFVLILFLLLLSGIINYRWFYFLNKKRGVSFVIKSMLYLIIEGLVITFGLSVGQIEYIMGKRY